MSETIRDNIIWNASIKSFRSEMTSRRNKVTKSLASLKNKGGLYASEHRRLVRLYADVLDVIDKHEIRTR